MATLTIAHGDLSSILVNGVPPVEDDIAFVDEKNVALVVTLGDVTGATDLVSQPFLSKADWDAILEQARDRYLAVGVAVARRFA